MKKILYFIITISILASCQSKNAAKETLAEKMLSKLPADTTAKKDAYDNPVSSLGTGIVVAPDKFDLYDDSLLAKKYKRIDIVHDPKLTVTPKYFEADYGIVHFVCISQSAKAYKILINYSVEKYLPKQKDSRFIPWDSYILQSFGVRRIVDEKHKPKTIETLYTEPQDDSKPIAIPQGHEMFCPMQVKGDWVQVQYDCFYNQDNNKHEGQPCQKYIAECKTGVTGWLRWRKDNQVLIEIFLE